VDVLSSVLRELRLDSATYRSLVLRAPWRLRFDGGLRGVHIVVRGRCTLTLDSGSSQQLEAGALVVLPRADSHVLSSPDGERAPVISSLELARRATGSELSVGGDGPQTRIVCGAFFLGQEDHPAVEGLPGCIHVPGQDGHAPSWLAGLVAALVAEIDEGGAGSEVVMARLSDALVTRALRHHLQTAEQPGWLRGLRDPHVSRALAVLHADVSAPWTVGSLARAAGLSRAAFAARFTRTVGRPPMDYVTHCRMRKAMTLLRVDNATVATVASRVGYGSEAALSAAFLRHTGTTPGVYRRTAGSTRPEARSRPPTPPPTPRLSPAGDVPVTGSAVRTPAC
jgi:AraC-like DNA-binding protein